MGPEARAQLRTRKGRSTARRTHTTTLPTNCFRNNRDGTFTDITESSGLGAQFGKGMGVAVADYDGDGLMDIFVANDSVPNFLFHNLATENSKRWDAGRGALNDNGGRWPHGADFRDFDNDGRPDLIFTAMFNDTFQLFRNVGGSPHSRTPPRGRGWRWRRAT